MKCIFNKTFSSLEKKGEKKRDDLLLWDPIKLAPLFNGWLAAGLAPECVKAARTVLLPKSSDPQSLADPGNWRPITIGSMLTADRKSVV